MVETDGMSDLMGQRMDQIERAEIAVKTNLSFPQRVGANTCAFDQPMQTNTRLA